MVLTTDFYLRSVVITNLVFIDIDERDQAGRTPLMWAAAYGQAPTVSLLLRHGAEVNAHGQESETALHLAAARGHHDVARILIASGATIDIKDENRYTYNIWAGHPEANHITLLSLKKNFRTCFRN